MPDHCLRSVRFVLTLCAAGFVLALTVPSSHAAPPQVDERFRTAEALYERGSFARAHQAYQQFNADSLDSAAQRWVQLRLADCAWRSQADSQNADTTVTDRAQATLQGLLDDTQLESDRDRVWVEAQESLADLFSGHRRRRDSGRAAQHYKAALHWWAGSQDLDLARERYLALAWKSVQPPWADQPRTVGNHQETIDILANVLRIARNPVDRARASYLTAMLQRNRGGHWATGRAVEQGFEKALEAGRGTPWYDDALFYFAEWLAQRGPVVHLPGGGWQHQPDFVRAVAIFRQLLGAFNEGETAYFDRARNHIKSITQPTLSVGVSQVFIPNSEIEYHLAWRNISEVELQLFAVDLTRDIRGSEQGGNWLEHVDTTSSEKVRQWRFDTEDDQKHQPGQRTLQLKDPLAPGAYLLVATAAGLKVRDVVLVTDASVLLKTTPDKAVVYFCDAGDGAPIADADVLVGEYTHYRKWIWRTHKAKTDAQGLAVIALDGSNSHRRLVVAARSGVRQALSNGNSYGRNAPSAFWRIYAFTDRPAYRPGDTAQWKFIARVQDDGTYHTPAGSLVHITVEDPRGSKVHESTAELNAFGSASGTLELTADMPLGMFNIQFRRDSAQGEHIGQAALLRLEEYKLPEFEVAIATPKDENGQARTFRVGESVAVDIQADYYFGGPVAGADVEVVVTQRPFYQHWTAPREFPWFYQDMQRNMWRRHGGGQVILRKSLETDANGKARLTFDTSAHHNQDFEYHIEARVTDSSRREIVGTGSVRVTRQRYTVHARPQHNIYQPQDKVRIDVHAQDANNRPQQVSGVVRVTRDFWYEIWIDPSGREVQGDQLQAARGRCEVFPPPPERPGGPGWQLKFRGYEHDVILEQTVKTAEDGSAEFAFTPEREGYYRVAWDSQDRDGMPIQTATTVWVASNATRHVGYHHGGVDIVVDKDTFRVGETAALMVSAPTNDRHVLLTIESEGLLEYQLVHLDGTVKLVQFDIDERYVPNIFIAAAMVSDRQMFNDMEQVIVPPTRNFLTVEVEPDQTEYEPRQEGTLQVVTRDHNGQPVSAEVAVGVVDEAVYYIQQDPAGDPRQFFFGTKRGNTVQTQSTFQFKAYAQRRRQKDARLGGRYRDEAEESSGSIFGGMAGGRQEGRLDDVASRLQSDVSGAVAAMPMEAQSKKMGLAMAEAVPPPSAGAGGGAGGDSGPAVVVRSDFRSTIAWQPHVVTDAEGRGTLTFKFPDSLTGWRAVARAVTSGNQFGTADARMRTRQPLMVRLQAPRFFVVGDEVVVSAVLHNHTDEPLRVQPKLAADGLEIQGLVDGQTYLGSDGTLTLAAHAEQRVDWNVAVTQAGSAQLTAEVRGAQYGDAMQRSYDVFEHGIAKRETKAGKVRGSEASVRMTLPPARRPGSTALAVQVTPSMAVTMLDALPYLVHYPYGCTEQTMSRFLPAVITARTLKQMGLSAEDAATRAFGGIESQFVDKTHPKGRGHLDALDEVTRRGLARLYDFQHADGGWGWWKGGDSDHYMSAYVVWGLAVAREAGLDVRADALQRGVAFLQKELVERERHFDMQSWMLHAVAVAQAGDGVSKFETAALDNLWKHRGELNAYTRALLALAAHHMGAADKATVLIENLENGVQRDRQPDRSVIQRGEAASSDAVIGTAHWGRDGIYHRWSEGGIEGTAFALMALLTIEPDHALIEPVSNWLIKNRRGAQWSNTRDTAITVLAMNKYLQTSGELQGELSYEVLVNGRRVATQRVEPQSVLAAPNRFEVDPSLLVDGENDIVIRRTEGQGPLYFAATADYFSLEEPITPAGHEIFVRRNYQRLEKQETLLRGPLSVPQPLEDNGEVISGERVAVTLVVEAKNDYEYLMFEDLKPAGLEAVEIRSGQSVYARELKSGAVERRFEQGGDPDPDDYTGRRRWVYQELRDRKVAMFIDKLPEGVWEITYEMRAEVPGSFHALPVMAEAMYVPEIRANGAEVRLTVLDR